MDDWITMGFIPGMVLLAAAQILELKITFKTFIQHILTTFNSKKIQKELTHKLVT